MFRLLVFLLDLVLMFSMSVLIFSSTSSLLQLGLGILLTIRVALNVILRLEDNLQIHPRLAINSLLQPATRDDRCPICHIDHMFEPRKLSCDHVFCRDCALLMLCKRDTCPLCEKIPQQQLGIRIAVPFGSLVAIFMPHAVHWLWIYLVLSATWAVPCVWQWRLPTGSELMLATIRASIQLALRTELVDIIPYIAYLRSRPGSGSRLVDTVAILCTSVVTLPYDYAAWMYLSLFAAFVMWQYWNDGL